ncbi:MAG: putative Rossmann fold flavoprotein [Bacteroidia bacterium]|jgi:predicted Rossmann fold flavoprotein
MKIAIIGGGAAGFFAAISAKTHHPNAKVQIFEKSQKLLAKVKVSGGGRCNVTNGTSSISELCAAYPRGGKQLKKAFHQFNTTHTKAWFESRGVELYTQDDGRVFPKSDNSQSIIDCLMKEVNALGIEIYLGTSITKLAPSDTGIDLHFGSNVEQFDKVIVATGGSPKREGLNWLEELGHEIVDPIPSLFTFKLPKDPISELMGLSVDNAIVKIQGTKLKSEGPLLITHWGMSGPAILKLSAFGARTLNDLNYDFKVQVNWAGEQNSEFVGEELSFQFSNHPKKLIGNSRPFKMPERLWHFLLNKAQLNPAKPWGEVGRKGLNRLVEVLTNDIYHAQGKTTFKEEFVTCGGVSLGSINMNTMQSKACSSLYFAGEVMDIDAITGGYNFQAAWTTGFISGQLG